MTRGDTGEGVAELKEEIENHRAYLLGERPGPRNAAGRRSRYFVVSWYDVPSASGEMRERLDREDAGILERSSDEREMDPIAASEEIFREV